VRSGHENHHSGLRRSLPAVKSEAALRGRKLKDLVEEGLPDRGHSSGMLALELSGAAGVAGPATFQLVSVRNY
jgi:hypothetical protein